MTSTDTIPALFFMMTFVVKRFNKGKEETYYGFTSGIITLCLLIGALYQIFEIRDIVRYKFIADDYNPTVTAPTLSDFLHTNDYPGAVEMLLESENDKIRKLGLTHLMINENHKIKQVSRKMGINTKLRM